MKGISIVVPVWNEEKNVRLLTEEISQSLRETQYKYELIFIDDHSEDKTREILKNLAREYPIRLFLKKGKQGKAYSLLEGFEYARYGLLGMIDGDLQYSPTYIPHMLRLIENGADIVITHRRTYVASLLRKITSKLFNVIFVQLLHRFNYDVQSGLKIFKKNILRHITLHPSSWTFDLELLLKARHAGYSIANLEIIYNKRHAGKSKIDMLKSSLEIGLLALRLKFMDSGIVPFINSAQNRKAYGFYHNGIKFARYTNLRIGESAFSRLTIYQQIVLITLFIVTIAGLLINWHATLVIFISFLTLLYFIDLIFNLLLVYRSYFKEPEINVTKRELGIASDSEWPAYTILCPLYKEKNILPQFISAMASIEYPKNKLQVMLLLEEDDSETQRAIQFYNLPDYFDVHYVPHSYPKTKPKALNYGLSKARGEYVVIYDAEDIPDQLQLKKAVIAFRKVKKSVICIQAKLNFYNPSQNVLTRLFSIEYSLWFDLVISGLQSIGAPIPLGGTSNHFRTSDLVKLKKWDPFNVTEDADLGMRIVKEGYSTAIINSYTMEEANSELTNWLKQRSRWIKGYIQTYFVHMRRPHELFSDWKSPHYLTFQLVIGTKILSIFINPVMWVMTIVYFVFRPYTGTFIQSLYLTPLFYIALFSLLIGNFLYMYYYAIGASKRHQWTLIPFVLLIPFYWLGMSIAALVALWEFTFKPHYWHKTRHGLHLVPEQKSINVPMGVPQVAV